MADVEAPPLRAGLDIAQYPKLDGHPYSVNYKAAARPTFG